MVLTRSGWIRFACPVLMAGLCALPAWGQEPDDQPPATQPAQTQPDAAEPPATQPAATQPAQSQPAKPRVAVLHALWFEGDPARREAISALQGKPPPPLTVTPAHDFSTYRGNVVLVGFWEDDCPACVVMFDRKSVFAERYRDKGLRIVSIGRTSDHARIKRMRDASSNGIVFVADQDGKTIADWQVDGFPDYYLIDRAGNLRAADVKNANVEQVIKALLEESPPDSES